MTNIHTDITNIVCDSIRLVGQRSINNKVNYTLYRKTIRDINSPLFILRDIYWGDLALFIETNTQFRKGS